MIFAGAVPLTRVQKLLPVMILAALSTIVGTPALVYLSRPLLVIVNLTGADGLTVLLDGEPVAERLPGAEQRRDAAFITKRGSGEPRCRRRPGSRKA